MKVSRKEASNSKISKYVDGLPVYRRPLGGGVHFLEQGGCKARIGSKIARRPRMGRGIFEGEAAGWKGTPCLPQGGNRGSSASSRRELPASPNWADASLFLFRIEEASAKSEEAALPPKGFPHFARLRPLIQSAASSERCRRRGQAPSRCLPVLRPPGAPSSPSVQARRSRLPAVTRSSLLSSPPPRRLQTAPSR